MKKLSIRLLLSLAIIFLFNTEVKSAWLFGADLSYTNIGQDSFIIKLVIYRDCNGAPTPNTVHIPIKCKTTNQTITTVSITEPVAIDITPVCSSECTRCQQGGCSFPFGIEKFEYQKFVVLNTTCCELLLSYKDASRSSAITTGAGNKYFYIEATLNRCITPQNSSPAFRTDPHNMLCIGQSILMNVGAYDTNNDSLAYEFAYPLQGYGSNISYTGQYDYDKPIFFWGFPNKNLPLPRGIHLDPLTADLSFRPMKIEQTVMVIKVSEFRNGIKIGEVLRDIQLIVINCPNNHLPKLNSASTLNVTEGDTVNYTFTTSDIDVNDTVQLWWDSSITNANWQIDTSNIKRPKGILKFYPDSTNLGLNIFTVSARDNACPVYGLTSRAYKICVKPKVEAEINVTNLGCGKYKFNTIPNHYKFLNYKWDIFDEVSNSKNPLTHVFSPGIYPFSLTVSDGKDTSIYYDTLITDTFLWAYLPKDTNICPGDSMTISAQIFNNQGYTSINWNTNDTTQSIQTAQLFQDKIYTVTVQDQSGCSFTAQTKVFVNYINVNLGQNTEVCKYDSIELDADYVLNGCSLFSCDWTKFGDTNFYKNTNNIFVHDSGTYICKITDDIGCFDSDTIYVTQYPRPNVYTLDNDSICSDEQEYLLNGKAFPLSGVWTGSGIKKQKQNYVFDVNEVTIVDGKKFTFNYLFTDTNNCHNSDSFSLTVFKSPDNPNIDDDFKICKADTIIQLTATPIGGYWTGNFVDSTGNFSVNQAGIGITQLRYIVGMPHCPKYDTLNIDVKPLPNVQAYTSTNKTKFCREQGLVQLFGSPSGGTYGGYWSGNVGSGGYFNTNKPLGDYQIAWHFTDNNGCYNADTITLSVVEPIITIDKSKPMVCKNNYYKLNAQFENAQGLFWTKGNKNDGYFVGSQYLNSIEYKHGNNDFQNQGFWIKAETQDPVCTTKYDSIFVQIGDIPIASFGANIISGEVPLLVNFHDSSTIAFNAISQYLWDFGDGNSSIVQNPTYTYQNVGNYDVMLKVISDLGCADSLTKIAFINAKVNGITEVENSEILIYPNPSNEKIYIKSEIKMQSINLYNSLGKLILETQDLNAKDYELKKQIKGIYFLKIGLMDENKLVQ
ncbi:MAG: PKD domain-containing protein, partial [Bacteroidota bacterium]|nr:PKD domain-containing protein [Bacteroidota bacterium]